MKASDFVKYIKKINHDNLLKESEQNVQIFTKDGAEFVVTDITISIVDNNLKIEISPVISPVTSNITLRKVENK